MSEDRVNQPKWSIQGSRVYGNGRSFNCTNNITATQLQNILNQYEKDLQLQKDIGKQFDNITRQIIALQMDLSNVQDTVNKIKEAIENVSTN